MVRAGVDEVDKAGAAVKLGKESSGIGLRLRAFDPLKAWSNATIISAPLAEHSAPITTHSHFHSLDLLHKYKLYERERF